MSLADKRAALARQIDKERKVAAALEAARQPIVAVDQEIDQAKVDALVEQVSFDDALKLEAQLFVDGQDTTAASADVAAKSQALDMIRRKLNALIARRAELESAHRDLALSQNIGSSAKEALIANVVSEEIDSSIDKMMAAATAYAAADARVRTALAHLVSKRWYGLAEKGQTRINTMAVPRWQTMPVPAWPSWLAALESDAAAPAPAEGVAP
jgi:hypothetical protein